MSGYTPIRCRGCGQVLRVLNEELPDNLQPGEWFERECKKCNEITCMALVERDSETVSK